MDLTNKAVIGISSPGFWHSIITQPPSRHNPNTSGHPHATLTDRGTKFSLNYCAKKKIWIFAENEKQYFIGKVHELIVEFGDDILTIFSKKKVL